MPSHAGTYIASVVIPAHDEERTIGRLLTALLDPGVPRPSEVLVLCNGCTDATAEVARRHPATVVELPEPSKRAAMRLGDELATAFPRVYLDADVEIDPENLRRLVDAVESGAALAAAPRRVVPRDRASAWVRWYYDVWEALPSVRAGLFGRGVIALSEAGNARVRTLPPSMSDDLVMSEAFSPKERVVVANAVVVVHPPRTVRDLVRRRTRVRTGNAEADGAALRTAQARTTPRILLAVARNQPRLVPKLPVFLGVTLAAEVLARRAIRAGDFDTWRRDESSRR